MITRFFIAIAPYRDLPDHAAWDWMWAIVAALWLGLTVGAIVALVRGAISPKIGSAVLSPHT